MAVGVGAAFGAGVGAVVGAGVGTAVGDGVGPAFGGSTVGLLLTGAKLIGKKEFDMKTGGLVGSDTGFLVLTGAQFGAFVGLNVGKRVGFLVFGAQRFSYSAWVSFFIMGGTELVNAFRATSIDER